MSLFNFTRQEQIAILFLSGGLLAGGIVTLVKRHHPGFAPELTLKQRMNAPSSDTVGVPEMEATAAPVDTVVQTALNINQATTEELVALPGIGPKIAERIIAYRTERGKFRTLNDLKGVNGIGDKTLERLRPFIKFD